MRFKQALFLIVIFGTGIVYADGIAIPEISASSESTTEIGAQRAVLWLDGSDLVLEIEPNFHWDENGAAWVIPLPARPEVFVGDSVFMDDLDWMTRPRFILTKSKETCHCSLFGGSSAGNKALGSGDVARAKDLVTVWQNGSLGNLDYVVISGDDNENILEWLDKSGYYVSDTLKTAFDDMDFSKKYFFAAKVSKSPKKGQTIGTIGFRFKDYDKPFYPVALTAAGLLPKGHLDVILWVIWPWEDSGYDYSGREYKNDDYSISSVVGARPVSKLFTLDLDDYGKDPVKTMIDSYSRIVEKYLSRDGAVNTILDFSRGMKDIDYTRSIIPPGIINYSGYSNFEIANNTEMLGSRLITNQSTLDALDRSVFLQRYLIRVRPDAKEDIHWAGYNRIPSESATYVVNEFIPCHCACSTGAKPGQKAGILFLIAFAGLILLKKRINS